jgi:hypothetical protein
MSRRASKIKGVAKRYPLWARSSRLKVELAESCSDGVAGCYPTSDHHWWMAS